MAESIELASIEQGDLREVWPSEATNFTPWLAENIEMLGEALGIDLEVQSTEVAIGPFSLDILAREPGADRAVAIENQLEETDHEHLGKLITYAGGSDARIVIWIAADFRDKHRQALDWLNQRSDDETEFFGVTVEIWKIDDSRPAPHFRIVAAPNHWSKSQRQTTDGARAERTVSEKAFRYQEFFERLLQELRGYGFTNRKDARPRHYQNFSSGHPGVVYAASFNHKQRVSVELYLQGDREWNKELFDNLYSRESDIAPKFGGNLLDWERLDHRKASRIALRRPGSIDDSTEALDETRSWFVENLQRFKEVFGPHLTDIVRKD